jgi:RNA recognition motif-containing protein
LKNIKVGNLDLRTTAESIRSFFEPLGTVHKVKLILDRKTGLSRGFAFIEMPVSDADKAIAALDGKVLDGQAVHIQEGRQKVHGLASPPHLRNDETPGLPDVVALTSLPQEPQ